MKILGTGCGYNKHRRNNPKDVIIGLDKSKIPCVDMVWDLEKTRLPFRKNEFDVVYASHVLEHVQNVTNLIKGIHRTLKPRGKFFITVPHFSWNFAFWGLSHIYYFGIHSLDPLIENQEFTWVGYSFSIKTPLFKLIKKRIETSKLWFFIEKFANKFPDIYEKIGLKCIFPASCIHFELEA